MLVAAGAGALGACQPVDHPAGRIEGAARVDLRIYNASRSPLRLVTLSPAGTNQWYGTGDIGLVPSGTGITIHPVGDLPFCRLDVYVSNTDGETATYENVDTCSYRTLRFPDPDNPPAAPSPAAPRVPHPGQQDDQLHPAG